MMGEQHVRSGVVFGLGLAVLAADYTGAVLIVDSLMFAAVAGGAALVPDWDTKSSTITRSLPLITIPVHWLIVWIHRAIYSATRRGLDPTSRTRSGWRGAHRGITHSIPTAVVVSVLLAAVLYALGPIASLILLVLLVGLAGDIVFAPFLLGAYALTTVYLYGIAGGLAHVYALSWLWAFAVLVGWIAHLGGDCPTTAGIPILAPFTWKKLVLPVSFRAGGIFEMYVVRYALIGAMAYLVFVLTVGTVAEFVGPALGHVMSGFAGASG